MTAITPMIIGRIFFMFSLRSVIDRRLSEQRYHIHVALGTAAAKLAWRDH
jgi:hypothetical protein